ncbi:MAG: hypothetical protein ACWA44_02675 [Thiotrichales bacterium]
MESEAEKFFILLEYLKESVGVSGAAAARAIGEKPSTVRNWKQSKKGPTKDHVHVLVQKFAPQLKSKAEELGILVKPSISDEERLTLLLSSARQELEKMEAQLEEAKKGATNEDKDREIEELRTENDRLKKQLDILFDQLENKASEKSSG